MHIFCSETGKWSGLIKFLLPWALPDLELSWSVQSVATNGTLHWLLGEKMSDQIKGILAINPFKFNFGVGGTSTTIAKPFPFYFAADGGLQINICASEWSKGGCGCRSCLGFRRMTFMNWEFGNWRIRTATMMHRKEDHGYLVHKILRLKRTEENRNMSLLSFHPNNGDVIFVLCGNNNIICKYEIGEDNYETVGEFPDGQEYLNFKYKWFCEILGVFTLVHPSWPTPIPTLPPVN